MLLDHGPWGIINNLGNCPNLWTWCTTLKHQWLLPSIVKGNDMLEANLVFTRVLSLHGSTPPFGHAFCHSHHPLSLFLVLVMVFCKMDCVFLIKIDVKPTYFESFMAWWHHLDMVWPWQDPIKGADDPKTSQDIIKVKVEVVVERLNFPSCLTYYAMTQTLNSFFASISLTCKAMTSPNVGVALEFDIEP